MTHEFGIMAEDPLPGERYDNYEPCCAIDLFQEKGKVNRTGEVTSIGLSGFVIHISLQRLQWE